MIRVFAGYERGEAAGFHVFVSSLIETASRPVALTPLASMGLPKGTNAFTLSRFLIPHLCGYQGRAIFVDGSDMAMVGDIARLDALFDARFAVQVVKHPDYQTRNPVKYVGTPLEADNRDYARKNWASVMLVNCANPAWADITPASIGTMKPLDLLQFRFLDDDQIGELPAQWNRLVDEGHSVNDASLLHWTAGIPGFSHYADAPGAGKWREHYKVVTGG